MADLARLEYRVSEVDPDGNWELHSINGGALCTPGRGSKEKRIARSAAELEPHGMGRTVDPLENILLRMVRLPGFCLGINDLGDKFIKKTMKPDDLACSVPVTPYRVFETSGNAPDSSKSYSSNFRSFMKIRVLS